MRSNSKIFQEYFNIFRISLVWAFLDMKQISDAPKTHSWENLKLLIESLMVQSEAVFKVQKLVQN